MENLEEYKKGSLSVENLDSFTDRFMRSKYDDDRRNRWQKLINEKHGIKRNQVKEPTKTIGRRLIIWSTAIAATVALLLFGRHFNQNLNLSTHEQLAETFITEDFYKNMGGVKGDLGTEEVELRAVFEYNEKNFTAAISDYQTIIAAGRATDEHHFFLGLSYLYSQEYNLASLNLLKVLDLNIESKFKQETRWFLALSYVKNKDLENAKRILNSINENDWNYEKAQRLLVAIE